MNDTIGYIFGKLNNSDQMFKTIAKNLNEQSKFNKSVMTFTVVTMINLYLHQATIRRANKEIEKLREEVEELKHTKGE